MRITLDKVSNARKDGKWGKLDIEYTRDGGKSSKRTLVAIGKTKDVMNLFRQDGAAGSDFEIEIETAEKNGETFYNWVGATKVEGSAKAAAKSSYQAKSTYETPEERARKNVSIARQNALTNAVAFLSAKDGKATPEQVVEVAREFAAFTLDAFEDEPVVEAPAPSKSVEDFDDDIPF